MEWNAAHIYSGVCGILILSKYAVLVVYLQLCVYELIVSIAVSASLLSNCSFPFSPQREPILSVARRKNDHATAQFLASKTPPPKLFYRDCAREVLFHEIKKGSIFGHGIPIIPKKTSTSHDNISISSKSTCTRVTIAPLAFSLSFSETPALLCRSIVRVIPGTTNTFPRSGEVSTAATSTAVVFISRRYISKTSSKPCASNLQLWNRPTLLSTPNIIENHEGKKIGVTLRMWSSCCATISRRLLQWKSSRKYSLRHSFLQSVSRQSFPVRDTFSQRKNLHMSVGDCPALRKLLLNEKHFQTKTHAHQQQQGITPYVRPTKEEVEEKEFTDGFLTPEEEENTRYPFIDPPSNLFLDSQALRLAVQQRMQKAKLQQQLQQQQEHQVEPEMKWRVQKRRLERAEGEKHRQQTVLKKEHFDWNCISLDAADDPEPIDVVTDLAELERFHKGLGPWPSTEALKAINALQIPLPGNLSEGLNPDRHFRKEITTIAEAQFELERWRPRMSLDRLYWVLDPDEESWLPENFKKRYRAVRRKLLLPSRELFTSWIGDSYAPRDEPLPEVAVPEYDISDMKPTDDMLRTMEDCCTWTPLASPVTSELDMYDDPPDALWRKRVEAAITKAVEWGYPERVRPYSTGFAVYDISWYAGVLEVVLCPAGGPFSVPLISLQDLQRFREMLKDMLLDLEDREQLYVLENHKFLVSALPAYKNGRRLLCCRRDFNEFSGTKCSFFLEKPASEVLSVLAKNSTLESFFLQELADHFAAFRGEQGNHQALAESELARLKGIVTLSVEDKTLRDLEAFLQNNEKFLVHGWLLGSPNPFLLALASEGAVCYVSHANVKKIVPHSPLDSSGIDGS